MTKNCGIILAHIKSTHSLYSILDYTLGVFTGSIKREGLSVGACIEYNICPSRTWTVLEDVNLLALPAIKEVHELLLFHCVIEICSHCMPAGSVSTDVFKLILCLYDQQFMNQVQTALLKKVFLCKLFVILGLYPHEKKFHNSFFHQLATESLDKLCCRPVSMVNERDIGDWLKACIATYAHDKKLNTIRMTDWLEIS